VASVFQLQKLFFCLLLLKNSIWWLIKQWKLNFRLAVRCLPMCCIRWILGEESLYAAQYLLTIVQSNQKVMLLTWCCRIAYSRCCQTKNYQQHADLERAVSLTEQLNVMGWTLTRIISTKTQGENLNFFGGCKLGNVGCEKTLTVFFLPKSNLQNIVVESQMNKKYWHTFKIKQCFTYNQ